MRFEERSHYEDEVGSPLLTRGCVEELSGGARADEPFHDWQRLTVQAPCGTEDADVTGEVGTERPFHDWPGHEVSASPQPAGLHPAAAERVDGVQHGPGMLAWTAANSSFEPTPMRVGDGAMHDSGGSTASTGFSGRSFRDLGEPIFQSLQTMLWTRTSKTMPMAQEFLFPLPLGDYDGVHLDMQPWVKAVLLSLNALYGAGTVATNSPTALQKRVVEMVVVFLKRMWSWSETVPSCSFDELFKVKGVDYRGEEIKLAKSFDWRSIAAAFPPEVGTLPIEEFCTGACRDYVLDFERFLLPQDQRRLGRVPRTMVDEADWDEVCAGLLRVGAPGGGERELRRDRGPTVAKNTYRVYLDNWDQLRKVDSLLAAEIEGVVSPEQHAMREVYEHLKLPRHPGKSVEGSTHAEVQGAWIDGIGGVAYAKPEKILKYMGLAWAMVQRGRATVRELQVVAGGLVYITLFRRQLLCSLNAIWAFIEAGKVEPPVVRRVIPREVKAEIIRFLGLIPLAQIDFRLPMECQATASDASTTGGGIAASVGLTSYGRLAQSALARGEVEEPFETCEVLTVGLFDGIGALRVATELLHLPVAGHISVECNTAANRVVEASFPGTRHVASVQQVTAEEVMAWACEYTTVGVVLIGAGPPCQGVSGLNFDRKGSQRDLRSCLYKEIPRIHQLVAEMFPWAQVHRFIESVDSMDAADRTAMSKDLGLTPFRVDSAGVSLARRPRLYWLSWELTPEEGFQLHPHRRPAGLHSCDDLARARWSQDLHRFPPYQYKAENCIHHASGALRVASIAEREAILGFPVGYTEQCLPKQARHGDDWEDLRKTLLGNSWSVPVVALLLKQLFEPLGLAPSETVATIAN
eukprot:s1097_g12.t1